LERALGKRGNPRGHKIDDPNALEAKAWDIRKRQEQTLADTLAGLRGHRRLDEGFSKQPQRSDLVRLCNPRVAQAAF